MRVLVIGGGGREHALCWKIARSRRCDELLCAPGNAGIAQVATCLPVDVGDAPAVLTCCRDHSVDLVVIGPEQPLVEGLADHLRASGISVFGPSAAAARLEGSKAFAKDFMARHGIPTARCEVFDDSVALLQYLETCPLPTVVKADGLAAGKGVIVCMSRHDALEAGRLVAVERRFGGAGDRVVVEEFMPGEEATVLALVDGEEVVMLQASQDHKRRFDGDQGPNTGGMGAYSPAPVMTEALEAHVMEHIINPTMAGMAAEGKPFKGVLYAGLMIDEAGPKLLEYNVRFGDPECQVLMARLMSDVLPALIAARDGVLRNFDLRWYDEAALTVVMAAQGYPGAYDKGSEIGGLTQAGALDDVTIFHAGTARNGDRVLATGGRVLGVTALGADVAAAQARAYEAIDLIHWPGGFCRRDIGWRAVGRG